MNHPGWLFFRSGPGRRLRAISTDHIVMIIEISAVPPCSGVQMDSGDLFDVPMSVEDIISERG